PLGLPPRYSWRPEPGAEPLRDREGERAADPPALPESGRAGPAVAAGLQGLRVRQAHLRPGRNPSPDQGRRRRRCVRLDAVESEERLHRRGASPEDHRHLQVVAVAVRRLLAIVLVAVSQGAAVLAGAQTLAREPNELGRVMILEYRKIDNPEGRWTRTPENFKRDLTRLWERGYRLVALTDYLDGKMTLPAGPSPALPPCDDCLPRTLSL